MFEKQFWSNKKKKKTNVTIMEIWLNAKRASSDGTTPVNIQTFGGGVCIM